MFARGSLILVLVFAAPHAAAAQIAPGAPGSDADDGGPPPPESITSEQLEDAAYRPTWSVLVPGIAIFGASWVANIVASLPAGVCGPSITVTAGGGGCVEDPGWDGFRVAGLVPLIGPWIQLAAKPGSLDDDRWALWLGIDGVVQLAGLIVLIAGAAMPEEREPPTVTVAPWAGPGGAGVTVAGRL